MTDKEDLQGSKCSTLTSDERAQIEQANDCSKERQTLCGQGRWGDSDNYLARSFGTLYKTAYSSGNRDDVEVRLDWCDHGHITHYFLDGYHIGNRPTSQVLPRDYLRSIWLAGKIIAYRLQAERGSKDSTS